MSNSRRRQIEIVEMRLATLVPDYLLIKELTAMFNITNKEAEKLINDAYAGMQRRAAGVQVEERRTQLRLNAQLAAQVAAEQGNVAASIKALEFLARLDGLMQTKVEVGMDKGTAVAMGAGMALGSMGLNSKEAVLARLEELRQRLHLPVPQKSAQLLQKHADAIDAEVFDAEEAGELGAGGDGREEPPDSVDAD